MTLELPAPAPVRYSELVRRLRDEADLCRNETATDVADLLDEAADALDGLEKPWLRKTLDDAQAAKKEWPEWAQPKPPNDPSSATGREQP